MAATEINARVDAVSKAVATVFDCKQKLDKDKKLRSVSLAETRNFIGMPRSYPCCVC